MKNLCFLFILLLSLSACSSSRVVLLENGKDANAIVVSTKAGELVLDQANTYTDLSSSASKKAEIKSISAAELQQSYGSLISEAPKAPINFLLYFEPNAAALTSVSKKQLPEIRQAIIDRTPCDVNIIGHADSTGSKEYNIKLSLKRARQVRKWLDKQDLDISNIIVESYGEEDPLIPTADGVPEPRNRRVEILIR